MEIVILDRFDFSVKDYAYVDSEYEIITDLVLTQKSSFKINKKTINANTGDFIYVKSDDLYFGVIDSIENEKDHKFITALDFKELLKIEFVATNYHGNLAIYIESLIRAALINNSDTKANMNYLQVSIETSRIGTLTFDKDKVLTIYELLDLVFKMYGIMLKYRVVIENGKIYGLELRIVNTTTGVRLKADNLYLDDLVINDSNKENINKVIYKPKSDNLFFKDEVIFYMLTDGSITSDVNHPMRFRKVIQKLETYTDNDYLDLSDKAKTILSVAKADHQITFRINKKTNSLDVLRNIEVGLLLEFIYQGKIYDSICSSIKYSNSLDLCEITLGEYRIKLTEKLQILNKGINSSVSNVTINNSGYSDLDGGEF